MFQMKTILFPVDFSDACQSASEEVAATAAHFGAKLLLFHVVQMQPVWYSDAVGYCALVNMDDLIDAKRQALSEVLRDRDDLDIRRVVASGDPAQTIVEYARNQAVDLIMMPSRGCGPFRRFLLGSVTAKVLHDVECPVWTDTHQQQFEGHESCRSVLCAVDLRPEMLPALQWASEFSHSEEADLRLIHAIPWYEDGHGETASLRHVVDDARNTIAGLEQEAGVEAPVFIKPGSVAEVLREAALKYAANLIVIGQGSLHKLMGRLRTSAYAIVREAPCPVVRV